MQDTRSIRSKLQTQNSMHAKQTMKTNSQADKLIRAGKNQDTFIEIKEQADTLNRNFDTHENHGKHTIHTQD